MNILGIEKSSFIDYPDKITTVVFTGGCNFRCPYCHNRQMVLGEGQPIQAREVLEFLMKRKKYIDAVCISGGEPTLQQGLYHFIKELKQAEFFVKLDTNGSAPGLIRQLLSEGLLDYVAMDIKAPLSKYQAITKTAVAIEKIKESIELISASSIDYEFRTTVCEEFFTQEDILEIAEYIKGARGYFLQNFRDSDMVLGGVGRLKPMEQKKLAAIAEIIKPYFQSCRVR